MGELMSQLMSGGPRCGVSSVPWEVAAELPQHVENALLQIQFLRHPLRAVGVIPELLDEFGRTALQLRMRAMAAASQGGLHSTIAGGQGDLCRAVLAEHVTADMIEVGPVHVAVSNTPIHPQPTAWWFRLKLTLRPSQSWSDDDMIVVCPECIVVDSDQQVDDENTVFVP